MMRICVYLRSSVVTLPDATKVSKISAPDRKLIRVILIDFKRGLIAKRSENLF